MSRPAAKERRKYPRIEQRLPMRVLANGYDLATTTENVSCVGAYCHLEKYIPPFTKLAVKVSLPTPVKNGIKDVQVECRGVIVRTEDDGKSGFNVAIFFNGIGESQRKKISQYISQFLPEDSSPRRK